jgi:hypothetical protein
MLNNGLKKIKKKKKKKEKLKKEVLKLKISSSSCNFRTITRRINSKRR